MGKSSSSSKKTKRSTDSSKLRSVKKKKSKRSKSKKIRRIKDSSDESYSDSSLYSSSDDDYRRRSKVSKKRSRKRYSSSESDDDDILLLKKKKSSKRKDKHVGKKNKKKKKKAILSRKRLKRDSTSSYTSSDDGSLSDDGSESDGMTRTTGKVKAAPRRSRHDSESDECCWQEEPEVMTNKNSTRLKSIIVVSYNYDNDERKDDHLTCGASRELRDSEESDERGAETSNAAYGYDEFEQGSKTSHPDNDLEAILKKRALENLIRFRKETQRSGMARKEESSSAGGAPLQAVEGSQDHGLMEQKLNVSPASKDFQASQKILQVVNMKEAGTSLADLPSQQDQQSGDTAKVKASSGISSCTTKRKLIRPVLGQESLNLASRKEAAGCQDAEAETINGSTTEIVCPQSSLALKTKNGGDNIEPTKISCTLNAESSTHTDTETLGETKGGSEAEPKTVDHGTKDESQYEQKTMTVMRGGELVQVKYKVYIPKKTSSLGRRQLKR